MNVNSINVSSKFSRLWIQQNIRISSWPKRSWHIDDYDESISPCTKLQVISSIDKSEFSGTIKLPCLHTRLTHSWTIDQLFERQKISIVQYPTLLNNTEINKLRTSALLPPRHQKHGEANRARRWVSSSLLADEAINLLAYTAAVIVGRRLRNALAGGVLRFSACEIKSANGNDEEAERTRR